MMRWLRAVLPPGWTLFLAGLIYLALLGVARFWQVLANMPVTFGDLTAPYLIFLAVLYAAYRVFVFHPAVRPGYFEWLGSTPWTSKDPLPGGPVQLVWQDLVILGAVLGIAWPHQEWGALHLVQTFLLVYLLSLALVHFLTNERILSYAIVAGASFMTLFWTDPAIFYPVAAASYGLAWWTLRRALARFPWEDTPAVGQLHESMRKSLEAPRGSQLLGWPHARMGPEVGGRGIVDLGLTNLRDVLLMGLLAGWWFFVTGVIFRRLDPTVKGGEYNGFYLVLMFAVAGRVLIYCDGYLSPLSLMGRLYHLRPIIPGYDKIFVAPLLALLVGVAAWYLPRWVHVDSLIIVSMGVTLCWWFLLGMGPSLREWRLTGNHRITRGVFVQKALVRTG